jgi:hypothetical protein
LLSRIVALEGRQAAGQRFGLDIAGDEDEPRGAIAARPGRQLDRRMEQVLDVVNRDRPG